MNTEERAQREYAEKHMMKARLDQLKSYPKYSGNPTQPFSSFWNAYKAALKEAGIKKHQRTPWVRGCCTGQAHEYAQNFIWNQPRADWQSWKRAMMSSEFGKTKSTQEALEEIRRVQQRGRSISEYAKEQEALHMHMQKEGLEEAKLAHFKDL